ncbi:hypothetical protein, partial [Nodularia sphaerocarpa]|uniref:hypothetical protein n=1 Tax=Nodularia sphaerocarpa TaxID=137816 RepID=UPI00232D8E30
MARDKSIRRSLYGTAIASLMKIYSCLPLLGAADLLKRNHHSSSPINPRPPIVTPTFNAKGCS